MHRWPALVRLRVRFRSTSARRFRSSLPVPCCTLFCESGACRAVAPERQRGAKAGDATRTRDIFLGKEVLYQLSYTRVLSKRGWNDASEAMRIKNYLSARGGGACATHSVTHSPRRTARAHLAAEVRVGTPSLA
jgi:hypothetical protein